MSIPFAASNAILAKSRSMYGKSLTSQDYSNLLSCNNVSEVASYLKQNTNYSDALSDLGEKEVHRGYLEILLRKKLFFDFIKIGRYEISLGEQLLEYIISRIEIEQIMHSLMLLSTGRSKEYIYSMPMFFNSHTHIDLPLLSKMTSFKDFLKVIKSSPYYDVLKDFRDVEEENGTINLTLIETHLYNYLYEKLFNIFNNETSNDSKDDLYDMITIVIDASNFVRIMRLKNYYHSSYDYIKSTLFNFGTLSDKCIDNLIKSKDLKESLDIISNTSFGKKVSHIQYNFIDEIIIKIRFLVCNHNIRYSTNSSIVLLSYVFLTEIEISNIINIIEGIRYNLPPEEIDKMLTYSK